MLEGTLRQQPTDGRSLFVDMNSFFASVEQELNPPYRDRPIGVCPFVSDATCVIAASIEAKRFGIKTGTSVRKAKELCPQIKLVAANPTSYREYHRRFTDQLDQTRGKVIVKSIDEALLVLPHDLWLKPRDVAAEVKHRIRSVGSQLKCSIGIGSNLFLAKMGSNLQKPDGLVEIKLQNLAEFYSGLKLTDLHGISYRLARRFKHLGIHTPLELYQTPYAMLRKHFGVNGESWYLRLRGYEVDLKPTTRRMIGHQTTIVPNPATNLSQVLAVAAQLTYKAAVRLRAADLAARGVVVGLRYGDRSWSTKVYHGSQAFCDSMTFFGHVERLLSTCRMRKPVRLVSVSAVDLMPMSQLTQSLFADPRREERLSQALDEINYRFGAQTILSAQQLLADQITDAVGFGNAHMAARELPSS